MKRQLFKMLSLLAIMLLAGAAAAQTTSCGIVITGSFDSECVYNFKGMQPDEYPQFMVACKQSTVTYTATADAGITVVTWLWYVDGDVSHSASGDQLIVNWSGNEGGMVAASAVTSDGDTCTAASYVKLIEIPAIAATTIPAYMVMPDGSKVIRVCEGATVEFIDCSSAGQSDIAGYNWFSHQHDSSSLSSFLIENVTMNDVVTHRVYNNCGCYDEESFIVEVIHGEVLQLDCYGTVCKGAEVKYKALNPECDEYHWYVDGGTLLDGQGTSAPTVQWDHPHEGYGVLGLDGVLCGEGVCPTLMSRRIPVIHDSITVDGPTVLCVGEAAVYTLPLFGSTRYEWTVTPATGINTDMVTEANRFIIVAEQAGTYTIQANYRCDFLDCGPYMSKPLTVIVKPQLEIAGNDQICLSNACDLHTVPAETVTWSVFDLGNNNALVPLAVVNPSTTLQATLPHKGEYLVTANHADYCGSASFVLHVGDVPAPTAADLDPGNKHTTCVGPGYGIVLRGTPSNPNYDLVWEPVCSTATPQQASGNQVTVHFPVEACDVRVYNYDRIQGCFSSGYYTHTVSELEPEPLTLPSNITACPGTNIVWGSANVPDQRGEGMLYEWSIEPDKQYCASVQGGHMTNAVSFTVNTPATLPETFYMKLDRSYCGGYGQPQYINITVTDALSATVSIAGPDSVCVGTAATYTGSGGTDASHYHWTIEGGDHDGNPVSHTFNYEGFRDVIMKYNPYTYCTNGNYLSADSRTVRVLAGPLVEGIVYNSGATPPYMSLSPTLDPTDYTFAWYYSSIPDFEPLHPVIPIGTGSTLSYMGDGYYRCVVTDRHTGCSTTVTTDLTCASMTLTHGDYDPCTHSVTLTSPYSSQPVIWRVTNGNAILETSGYNNRQCTVTAESIGYITVEAKTGMLHCYKGIYSFLVDFIPDFTFTKKCGQVVIHNNSRYLEPGLIRLKVDEHPGVHDIYMPSSQQETYYPSTPIISGSKNYTFSFYSFSGNVTPCGEWPVEIKRVSRTVAVGSANPGTPYDKTCDNTPIELTAYLSSPASSVLRCEWDFGDGSSLEATGASVYHTFEATNDYHVSVKVTDMYGCPHTANDVLTIESHNNNLLMPGKVEQANYPVCPGNPATLVYSPGVTANYYWRSRTESPIGTPGAQIFQPTQPEDYIAYVTNSNYCKHEASAFANFKDKPEAKIIAERSTYCKDNEMKLFGETQSSYPLSYQWNITSQTTPNITTTAYGGGTGTMSVTLTVTNNSSGCLSTATRVFNVTNPPPAPTINVIGASCISNAPVQLSVTGYSGTVSWNNGNTGPTAHYYTPGLAKVYYYDPTQGCPSNEATLVIDRQPDLGALLTGCYEKCKEQMAGYLPVYGLTEYNQSIGWHWDRNGTTVASGTGSYFFSPLMLPLGAGIHTLTVDYSGSACSETSGTLTITGKDVCDCDSVDVVCTIEPEIEDCEIHYKVSFEICNRSVEKDFCIDNMLVSEYGDNVTVTYDGLTGASVAANDCATFTLEMDVASYIPPMLNITLEDDECSICTKQVILDLRPEIECIHASALEYFSLDVEGELTNSAAAYMTFSMQLPLANLLALWTEPPMVVDFMENGMGMVSGLLMLDRALLSQFVAADSVVCFYAIVCINDRLCMVKHCIKASGIQEILDKFEMPEGDKGMRQIADSPQLKPNPASGTVMVTDTHDRIVELLVLDIHGRRVATHTDTDAMDTKPLPAGTYIVRITTVDETGGRKVIYRKLIVIE